MLLATSCRTKLFKLSTDSPNRTYSVSLVEHLNPPGEPYNYMVGLKIFKGGQLIVDVPRFSGGDDFDRRFGDEYSESLWLSENLLRLGSGPKCPVEQCDRILVSNETTKLVVYFMVESRSEMFLILELNPQSTIRLYAQPQTDQGADLSWIGYAGQFDDKTSIPGDGMSFRIRGKYKGVANYCITIRDGAVIVNSADFEGVKFLSGVEKTTPKATDCGE